MKEAALSFLIVLAVEAISAVVEYLKNKLMNHINRQHGGFGEPAFA